MADFDNALVHQILNGAERQRKSDVQHYRQANDFRAALKALKRVGFGHVQTLRGRPGDPTHVEISLESLWRRVFHEPFQNAKTA
ncbi:hypothetical protein [Ruegeria profundi]|uniref:hypothetical protein n=1 Tax=Ruegeria profundi TaxID=1685378 RepID=UPI00384B7AAC